MRSNLKLILWGAAFALIAACTTLPTPSSRQSSLAFRYQSVEGGIDTLGRHRGKIVLVSVFATWAEPALLEVPLFRRLQKKYGSDQFVIIQIALDEQPEAVGVYTDTFKPEFLVGWPVDRSRFASSQGPLGKIEILPSSILLDRFGRVTHRQEGTWDPENLEELITSLLAEDRSKH